MLINGGPISIDEIKGTGAAVLAAGFPGQAGGQAIAQTLFGVNNPSGKLTTTIYPGSYANGEPLSGTPWMDSSLRPRAATNLPASEGRTHMFYTGTPLFGFGFGLSFTSFSLAWGQQVDDEVSLPLEQLDSALANTSFAVKVSNTGKRAGKETVMAYWSPPKTADPDLKQQLFDFKSVLLAAGESATLTFEMPSSTSLATVAENGDRVFYPGQYTVRFSRGHGTDLTKPVTVMAEEEGDASAPVMLSEFPSRFVEGHEVTVDACVEGTTDVIAHTESFLVGYKQWAWVEAKGQLTHTASGMCLLATSSGGGDSAISLGNCSSAASKWAYSTAAKTFKTAAAGHCLVTAAVSTGMLRVGVGALADTAACATPSGQWTVDGASGFVRSAITNSTGVDTPFAAGRSPLCLAARGEGIFNTAS